MLNNESGELNKLKVCLNKLFVIITFTMYSNYNSVCYYFYGLLIIVLGIVLHNNILVADWDLGDLFCLRIVYYLIFTGQGSKTKKQYNILLQ